MHEKLGETFFNTLLPIASILVAVLFIRRILISEILTAPFLVESLLLIAVTLGWIAKFKKRYYSLSITTASLIFIITLLGTLLNGGATAPAYIGILVPISYFAWITSPRITYISIFIAISASVVYLILPHLGIPTSSVERTYFDYWISYTFCIIIITHMIITGTQLLHQALKDSEEDRQKSEHQNDLLDTTFSSIMDSLVVYDAEFAIVKVNSAAEELYTELNTIKPIESLFDITLQGRGRDQSPLREILKANNHFLGNQIYEYSSNNHNNRRWFSISASSLKESQYGNVVILKDISEQINQEEKLAQAQKMDAVGQLASGIAHDFNNMLAGIQGAADLLQMSAHKEQSNMLNLIMDATEKASRLTRELLVFSRKTPQASTAVDVHRIIDETTFLLSRTIDKRISINKELSAANALVIGDDTLIQNALMNMGINASHAMPEGGTLTFRTSEIELDELYCNHSEFTITPGNYLSIEIIDTGCGMTPEVQKHIFEPFFTTKEVGKGTGLGMAAVYGMVTKHMGAITIYSEVGTGTAFHILLPLTPEITVAVNSVNTYTPRGSGTVLIADDEEFIRITTTELLKSLGYTVYSVKNGQEALDFLHEHSVDVILLDMIMPTLNGRQTFEKIIEQGITAKVILSSGFSKEEDVMKMKEQGLFGFLHKPYQRSELSQMIANAVTHPYAQKEPDSQPPFDTDIMPQSN